MSGFTYKGTDIKSLVTGYTSTTSDTNKLLILKDTYPTTATAALNQTTSNFNSSGLAIVNEKPFALAYKIGPTDTATDISTFCIAKYIEYWGNQSTSITKSDNSPGFTYNAIKVVLVGGGTSGGAGTAANLVNNTHNDTNQDNDSTGSYDPTINNVNNDVDDPANNAANGIINNINNQQQVLFVHDVREYTQFYNQYYKDPTNGTANYIPYTDEPRKTHVENAVQHGYKGFTDTDTLSNLRFSMLTAGLFQHQFNQGWDAIGNDPRSQKREKVNLYLQEIQITYNTTEEGTFNATDNQQNNDFDLDIVSGKEAHEFFNPRPEHVNVLVFATQGENYYRSNQQVFNNGTPQVDEHSNVILDINKHHHNHNNYNYTAALIQNVHRNHVHQNKHNIHYSPGSTGTSGTGGGFVFLSDIVLGTSNNISFQIDQTNTNFSVEEVSRVQFNNNTATIYKPSGSASGISVYSNLSTGTGGAGGAGSNGIDYDFNSNTNPPETPTYNNPPNNINQVVSGSSGQGGYCRIYFLKS